MDNDNNHEYCCPPGNTTTSSESSSLERALSDIEIVRAAYPDETTTSSSTATVRLKHKTDTTEAMSMETNDADTTSNSVVEVDVVMPTFPLHVTLYLSTTQHTYIVLEWNDGYPTRTPLQIARHRNDDNPQHPKQRIEQTVHAVRATALEYFEDGVEAGLACCSTALETWNNYNSTRDNRNCDEDHHVVVMEQPQVFSESIHITYPWFTSSDDSAIHDRKSIFVGHVCPIHHEAHVQPALQQLLCNNNKLQRATHHMVRTCIEIDWYFW
jgi:Uncharacterized protein family UPF0029